MVPVSWSLLVPTWTRQKRSLLWRHPITSLSVIGWPKARVLWVTSWWRFGWECSQMWGLGTMLLWAILSSDVVDLAPGYWLHPLDRCRDRCRQTLVGVMEHRMPDRERYMLRAGQNGVLLHCIWLYRHQWCQICVLRIKNTLRRVMMPNLCVAVANTLYHAMMPNMYVAVTNNFIPRNDTKFVGYCYQLLCIICLLWVDYVYLVRQSSSMC